MNGIIKVVDNDGVELHFRYLFDVVREETGEPYAFYLEITEQQPRVVVYKIIDGQMKMLDTEEEIEYAQKVFYEYASSSRGGCGGCSGCHGGSCDGDCDCDCDCE